MKIDLLTRIQYKDLYWKMKSSAIDMAMDKIGFLYETDTEGSPKIARTYNRLAKKSKADMVCCVHDDVKFLSKGWDRNIIKIFEKYKPDIVGVIGAKEYWGGQCFDAGHPYLRGLVAGEDHQTHKEFVKIVSPYKDYEDVKVIDALIMFIDRKWLIKNKFDEKNFDELFYYDLDLCLRAKKVGVTCDILVKHYKDLDRYLGNKFKPISAYTNMLYVKHNIKLRHPGDSRCFIGYLDKYYLVGQNMMYEELKRQCK